MSDINIHRLVSEMHSALVSLETKLNRTDDAEKNCAAFKTYAETNLGCIGKLVDVCGGDGDYVSIDALSNDIHLAFADVMDRQEARGDKLAAREAVRSVSRDRARA